MFINYNCYFLDLLPYYIKIKFESFEKCRLIETCKSWQQKNELGTTKVTVIVTGYLFVRHQQATLVRCKYLLDMQWRIKCEIRRIHFVPKIFKKCYKDLNTYPLKTYIFLKY
jgi:hypothetical protein